MPAEPEPLTTDGLPADIVKEINESHHGPQEALEGYQYVVSEFLNREFPEGGAYVAARFDELSDSLRNKVLKTLKGYPCRSIDELADRVEGQLTLDEEIEAREFARSIGL